MTILRSSRRGLASAPRIERLEARTLLSIALWPMAESAASPVRELAPASVAAAVTQASGVLGVSLKVMSTSVHESQVFSAKVTVINNGTQTVGSVTPHLTQATGQLVQAKYYSPTVASIAAGKSAVFTFSLIEQVVGADTLTADADSPFGMSSGAVSVSMTVLPKTVGNSALTDASGEAYLKVGASTVPVQIADQNTGLPVAGLSLAIAGANRQNSRAVVVVGDGQNRYPLQTIVLEGPAAQAARPAVGNGGGIRVGADPSSPPASLEVASGSGTALSAAVNAIETDFLPPVQSGQPAGSVSAAVLTALKTLAMSKLPLPLPLIGSGPPKTLASTKVNLDELTSVVGDAVKHTVGGVVVENGAGFVIGGALTGVELPALAITFVTELGMAAYESDMAEDTDATDAQVSILSCGGIPYISITPLPPSGNGTITWDPKGPVADVTIHPTGSGGQSFAGGSYELISKDDLSRDIVGVLDSNGSADIPVELDNYTAQVWTPGDQTFTDDSLNVTASGATVNPTLAPQPIASGTLTTPVGQATGFLAPGTQYTLAPNFFDAAGNPVQPVGPVIFQVHNPVGAIVATVDPNTGVVTMGPGFGAALITAWCDGVTTTAKLVSTNGNGKYPVQPSTPFAVSPTTLHFTADQGGPNPAAQSFNVIGLSSKFSGFHYTDSIGWITVAGANVANYNVFNVSVNVSGLSPGNYTLPVTVSDDNSSYRQTVMVSLTVVAQPTPTLAASYSGPWTYPVFGFGDDYATLTLNIHQSGHDLTGSYVSTILDGSVDTAGEVNTDTFTGTIEGNSIVLNDTGGSSFFATITGNTLTGTSNYLQATSSFTLTAQ